MVREGYLLGVSRTLGNKRLYIKTEEAAVKIQTVAFKSA
jgi:hypothetical protein